MDLLANLGLDSIPADPNDIPDGKYDGDIFQSEYVLVESKRTIAHVTTFRVTEGEYKGAQKQKWDTLYDNVSAADGSMPSKLEDVSQARPAQTDQQKRYYKKFWVDMGVPEDQVSHAKPEMLVGKLVTFGIKTKDGYKNINFQELRAATPQAVNTPIAFGQPSAGGTVDTAAAGVTAPPF